MKSNNQLWKLDLLESKFKKTQPRFNHTRKLLLSIANNGKLGKKLPKSDHEAFEEIDQLKSIAFENKYHSGYAKLEKEIKKILKTKLIELFLDESALQQFITSKVIKCIQNSILINKELRSDPPYYIDEKIRRILMDKSDLSNPSGFFKNYCQNDKIVNNNCSNLSNNKNMKKLFSEIEWSFKIVRGDLTKEEKDERKKLIGGDETVSDEEIDAEELNESESESSQDDNNDVDLKEAYDNFVVYENEDKDEEDEQLELDPSINYNEVTDEEPSEDEEDAKDDSDGSSSEVDDFFEEEPLVKRSKSSRKEESKYNLPELATGYYSGGSDDEQDVDNDKIVKGLTTQRKNRRGQRARQKIWEKKFGKEAKHVKKEKQRESDEREKRRLEYEERERKRQLKAQQQKPTGANSEPLGERNQNNTQKVVNEKMHPSWEAKKQAEAKLKSGFQGKKVVFD